MNQNLVGVGRVGPVCSVIPVIRSLDALSSVGNVFSTLPRGPVEPAFIALQSQNQDSWGDDSRISCTLETLGQLFAPCGVRADNILVRGLSQYVRPGRPLQFELVLNTEYPSRTRAELHIAAASLAFHAHVSVLLVSPQVHGADGAKLPLQAAVVVLAQTETGSGIVSVSVTIELPESIPRDAEVVIDSVTFAGQAVSRCLRDCAEVQALPFYMPVRLRVVTGMQAPLRLEGAVSDVYQMNPVITPEGMLYAPKKGSFDVLVFAADGTPLPSLPLTTLGLSSYTRCAAFVDGVEKDTGTLLLADVNNAAWNVKLFAVDAASRAVRWSSGACGGSCYDCYGIAVLPAQGVAIVSDMDQLHAHRLSDGFRVDSISSNMPNFVAADPATATVYVSALAYDEDDDDDDDNDFENSSRVIAFRWNENAFVFDRDIETFENTYFHPLAVVPPVPGQHTSFLVVGTLGCPTLRVLSLSDCCLVHTHELEGMEVAGLAADPSGTALAVCDAASKAIHVLPWPLHGMEF
jgi:hypothetical protein